MLDLTACTKTNNTKVSIMCVFLQPTARYKHVAMEIFRYLVKCSFLMFPKYTDKPNIKMKKLRNLPKL